MQSPPEYNYTNVGNVNRINTPAISHQMTKEVKILINIQGKTYAFYKPLNIKFFTYSCDIYNRYV